jgi:predicted RNase H-like HicB family nuclease
MKLSIQLDLEDDGRWIAEVVELPGVIAYAADAASAIANVKALALRVIAERKEHGEPAPEPIFSTIKAA